MYWYPDISSDSPTLLEIPASFHLHAATPGEGGDDRRLGVVTPETGLGTPATGLGAPATGLETPQPDWVHRQPDIPVLRPTNLELYQAGTN